VKICEFSHGCVIEIVAKSRETILNRLQTRRNPVGGNRVTFGEDVAPRRSGGRLDRRTRTRVDL
jgi:hypothetical protein